MFSIIVLILKIIGIILLSILGLLVLILSLVLLVPIRYRIYVEHGETFHMEGTVSWLLHFIHAGFTGNEFKPHIRVRILGFVIYDSKRVKKPKSKEKIKRKPAVKKGRSTSKSAKGTSGKVTTNTEISKKVTTDIKPQITEPQTRQDKDASPRKELPKDEIPEAIHKFAIYETVEDTKNITAKNNDNSVLEINTDNKKKEKQTSLGKLIKKLKQLKNNIKAFFKKLWDKLKSVIKAYKNIQHKYYLITDFLKDELNKDAFRFLFDKFKKLLKHILPTKLKSTVVFGTGDPCSTGQLLGVLGIFYGIYGDKVKITPDFENQRFEGRHYARGRIRLATILIIIIKLILDKRFTKLRSNFKILKEAL